MKRIHFIAIGGAIMHQLAIALQRKGHIISGSDDEINDPAKSNLSKAGILPKEQGWFPSKITNEVDVVVLGMHAKKDNAELLAALKLGIPIQSFPEFIYELSKDKKRVVIAGSHGKTTITSMVMHVLRQVGMDIDYLVGAQVAGFEGSVKISDAPIIILEGDEYPASVQEPKPKIFFYHPHVTLISGIAWDHINVFPTYENYFSQFVTYVQQLADDATIIYNQEDEEVKRLISTTAQIQNVVAYETPKYHHEQEAAVIETPEGPLRLNVFGRHNLLNLMGAKAVCAQLGVMQKEFFAAITSYQGAAKRLQKLFQNEHLIVYRDFAHAPSKLKATLSAVREAMPKKRLLAVFELHTFSSLNNQFLSQYKDCMQAADDAVVYFSSHALSLKSLPMLSATAVRAQFNQNDLQVFTEPEVLKSNLSKIMIDDEKEVCLLLMSSGTFDGIDWPSFLAQL